MRALTRVAAALIVATSTTALAQPPLKDGYPSPVNGLIYKDAATGVICYVETDGRHVAAISPEGKLLWRKNPFVDAGLEPYRMSRPIISSIGSGDVEAKAMRFKGNFVSLVFTSSQFGLLDIETGKFTFMGQN